MRHFVFGDIHGQVKALDAILNRISPTCSDRLTFLGDYIDYGPDSKAVLDRIISLGPVARPVAGNHERFLPAARTDPELERAWLRYGGGNTLESFGVDSAGAIPRHYVDWIARLPWYREDQHRVFVHAGANPLRPMHLQEEEDLLWKHRTGPVQLRNGRTLVCGHTPRNRPLVLPGYISLDTGVANGGVLSCLNLGTNELLQADCEGKLITLDCRAA